MLVLCPCLGAIAVEDLEQEDCEFEDGFFGVLTKDYLGFDSVIESLDEEGVLGFEERGCHASGCIGFGVGMEEDIMLRP